MSLYLHEERAANRALIDRTGNFLSSLEDIAAGKRDFSPDLAAILTGLTKTSDMDGQHRALTNLLGKIKKHHKNKLVYAAREELSAFAEVMNPNEPPARHHVFMCETLHGVMGIPDGKLMVSMPPGHAKPLCVETPVMMADGAWKRLGDIEIGDRVITMHGRPREVLAVHDQGKLPTLEIRTSTGRTLHAGHEHGFLTPSGWMKAEELTKGSTLALVRDFEISDSSGRSHDDFALAGYMMAAGMVRGRAYSRMQVVLNKFRTDDEAILRDVLEITKRKGFTHHFKRKKVYGEQVRTVFFDESFSHWLRLAGLYKVKRHTMRVPEWVFRGDGERIGAFLGAIFAMDANLVPKINRHTGKCRVLQIMLRNRGLVEDLQNLLMRLGARSGLMSTLHNNYNYEPTEFFRLSILDGEDQAYLAGRLRIRGSTKRFWDKPPAVERFFSGLWTEDKVISITPAAERPMRCITVEEDASFLAAGIVVHNSTYFTHLFPAWFLGRYEGRKYLQAGHTQKFVEKQFCARVKNYIGKEAYREVFPDVVLITDAAAEFTLTNGGEYNVKGVGQGIAGYRSHVSGVDDPIASYKHAQSPTIRDTTWEWLANDFLTRQLPGGQTFIIATRWHTDDPIGRIEELMKKGEIDPWEIINLPAYSLGIEDDPLGRQKGDVLWPELFEKKWLENQRKTMSEIRWSCLYQGSPVLERGNILQRQWIGYYKQVPLYLNRAGDPRDSTKGRASLPPEIHAGDPQDSAQGRRESRVKCVRTIVSVDSAEKATQRADNSAIQVWREGDDKNHYLCHVTAEKFEFPDLVNAIETIARRWQADMILIEEKGAGNQYIQERRGKAPCPIIGYNPGKDDKEIRFEGTMMMWRTGLVLLPENAPWLADYLDELLKFPSGSKDDNVDATSQYLQWVREGGQYRRGTRKLRGAA